MKRLTLLLILINLTVSFNALAKDETTGTGVGNIAPEISLNRIDGTEFRLSDFRGKKAVNLVFWATWCSNCKAEIPSIKKLSTNYHQDIELLAINVNINDSMRRLEHYRKKHDIEYPMAFDHKNTATKAFGVMGTPTILIIDIDGIIRYRGAEIPNDIDKHLDVLMGR